MPPMPPIPPIPPWKQAKHMIRLRFFLNNKSVQCKLTIPPIPGAPAGSSFGISVTTASAVVNSDATPDASVNAVRTTFRKRI